MMEKQNAAGTPRLSKNLLSLVVATPAAVDRHGPGSCDAPLRAAERRSTEPEDSHQGRGRDSQRPTGTEDSTSWDSAGARCLRCPAVTAVTVGSVATAVLLGSAPRLQGDDAIDGCTVRFLLQRNQARQREEGKARRRELEEQLQELKEELGEGGVRAARAGTRPPGGC